MTAPLRKHFNLSDRGSKSEQYQDLYSEEGLVDDKPRVREIHFSGSEDSDSE
jgi:hypothetical protein